MLTTIFPATFVTRTSQKFFRERFEMAKVKQSFWQDYKFADPLTRNIEPKQMYCERTGDLVVCGGIYKL